jgi:sialate O-acetylesterase
MKKNIFVLCIMVLFAPLSWSAIEVSAVFSDRAVLQGGKDLPVWGWGEPGDAVSVSFAGQTELTTVEADGSWRVTLSPVAASYTKYTMEINVGAESLELVDLLVGEVWLGSGQSNMALAFDGFAPSKDGGISRSSII